MDIDTNAPVITRDEILIAAPLEIVWNAQTNISLTFLRILGSYTLWVKLAC